MQRLLLIILHFALSTPVLIAQDNHDSVKYPIPEKTDNLLFYIQRNHNSNTVIYDVNFNENGFIDNKNPVNVYWRRYDEQGQKRDLTTIEKQFAYGVRCSKIKKKAHAYNIKLVAYGDRQLLLKQDKPFQAMILISINGELSILDHLYIYADNTKLWPEVIYVELFGKCIKSGNKTYEKIIV